MSTVALPKPLPPPEVPFIDPKTGKISQPWREYLESFDRALRALVALS